MRSSQPSKSQLPEKEAKSSVKQGETPKKESKQSAKKQETKIRDKKQIIHKLVIEWSNNFYNEKKDLVSCFQVFLNSLQKSLKMKIKFDNSISSKLVQLSKQIQFLQFDEKKQNYLKTSLEIINQTLKQNKFISLRQYNKFKSQFFSNTVQDSMYFLKINLQEQGYLKKRNEIYPLKRIDRNDMSADDMQILKQLWQISMQISLQSFWRYLMQEKFQHRQILPLYMTYQKLIQAQVSKRFRIEIGSYLRQVYNKKKQQDQLPLHKLQTSIVQYDHFLDLKAEYISVYLNKQRWGKYNQQYLYLTQFLRERCNKKQIRFQPYGSFENKFYILNYSDIDIGLFYEGNLEQRKSICNVLSKIQSSLEADKSQIPGYLYSKTYSWQMIKVPFVKVIYNNHFGQNKDIVPSMDIIINNYQGIQNSKLLALYAQDTYLLKFCNLIKYWAVRTDLINVSRKFQGLTSYGVLLMCLYYLMVTNQIPYLQKLNVKYDIGKQKFEISLNFLDNFIGFVKFYSNKYKCADTNIIKMGRFHKEKRIVCLLQDHGGKKVYDQSIIINMYDFIDGSNPGRMKTYLYGKFTQKFDQTLQCLQNRSLSFLENIYSQKQNYGKQQKKYSDREKRYKNQNIQNDKNV